MIAVSFTNKTNRTTSVVIQSVDQKISPVDIFKTVQVISDRLKSFSTEKADINPLPQNNQIKISFIGKWNLNKAIPLLVQRGEIAFYECYNRNELSGLLHGDNHLFSLLVDDKNADEFRIGCSSSLDINKVNDYTRTLGLTRQCKFLWSETRDSEACLYALKVTDGKNPLLTWKDIQKIKRAKDKEPENYTIEIRFRKSAVDTWAEATRRNINKPIAIVLDDKVLYAPVLKSEIKEGLCAISGNFNETEVDYFAAIGNNGILPFEFKVIRQK